MLVSSKDFAQDGSQDPKRERSFDLKIQKNFLFLLHGDLWLFIWQLKAIVVEIGVDEECAEHYQNPFSFCFTIQLQ
jgi:hypothetical protein